MMASENGGEQKMESPDPLRDMGKATLPAFVVGGVCLLIWLEDLSHTSWQAHWPRADAVVTVHELRVEAKPSFLRPRRNSRVLSEEVYFSYRYNVDGRDYSSTNRYWRPVNSTTGMRRNEYPAGAQVQVYYMPSNPSVSVVKPTAKAGGFFVAGFVFVAGAAAIRLALSLRRAATRAI
jgi:hypothetical protein